MVIEVIGYKGVVGNATYQWLTEMGYEVIGRDKGDAKPSGVDVSIICVPEAAVEVVALEAFYADWLVIRSTVHPGVCEHISEVTGKHVCHVPEFLREASAVVDAFNPAYILIGACCSEHGGILKELYSPAQVEIVITDTLTSELVNIVTNNYLSCLIIFCNEMDAICEASGVKGHKVGAIVARDPRVSPYGARYHHKFGGKCLPKELDQMLMYARGKVDTPMLKAIQEVNLCEMS
jgi:nucleotide sugar dehydrogenase